jgi:hypothetical protein
MRQLRAFCCVCSVGERLQSCRELDEELSPTFNSIDDNIAAGLTPGRRSDRRTALGGVETTCERVRERCGFRRQLDRPDWRPRVRSGAHSGFTVIILTLAIGSGANAAIFSIFNQALVRALPVPTAEQLVNLSSPGPRGGRTSTSSTFTSDFIFSYPLFRDLERTQTAFSGIAGYREFTANVSYHDQASTADGMLVSGSYFPVLGIAPAVGRLLTSTTIGRRAMWRC